MKTTPLAMALFLAISATATAAPQATKADPKMAQTTEKAADSAAALVAQARADIQKDRNAIVGAGMDLTDAQAGPFWDLYAQYRAARKPAADRLTALVIEYAETMDTITDAQAVKPSSPRCSRSRSRTPRIACRAPGGTGPSWPRRLGTGCRF